MRKYVTVIGISMACCLFVSGIAQGAERRDFKDLEVGLAFDLRKVVPKEKAIPQRVRQEASNPSIVNPYSGNYFDKDKIGTYNPRGHFNFYEVGLFAKYTLPLDFPIKPYFRAEILYPFLASTHKGSFGRGYTYSKVLGGGVDYVRYIYGIKYEYKYWLEPEIGLSYLKEDSFSISFGIGFQELKLTYLKGIEAWGEPQYYEDLASSKHTLYNYKVNFTKFFIDKDFFKKTIYLLSLEPSITRSNNNEIRGWSIALSFQRLF
jgi:hypothetical protein